MINAWIDQPDNGDTELALHALALDTLRWNGFPVPIATRDEFQRFLDAQRENDPNGEWDMVVTDSEQLKLMATYDRETGELRDAFPRCDVDGTVAYALSGWVWSL